MGRTLLHHEHPQIVFARQHLGLNRARLALAAKPAVTMPATARSGFHAVLIRLNSTMETL